MDIFGIVYGIVSILVTIFLGYNVVKFLYPWLINDLKFIKIVLSTFKTLEKYKKKDPPYTIIDKLVDEATSNPNKEYIFYKDQIWTFRELNNLSNQVARVMHEAGAKINETIGLMMVNRPEFIGINFGIGKTGATTSLISHKVRKKSLLHLLRSVECKILIISNEKELVEAVEDVSNELKIEGVTVYCLGDIDKTLNLEILPLHTLLESQEKTEIPVEWRKGITMKSHFCYVYTSGTTGLPKAAVMQYDKAFLVARLLAFSDINAADVIYIPLPLFHTSSLVGVFGAINLGCSIILRRKFSASHFWEDCLRYRATVIQYVGETMRYVCDQPASEDDLNHNVRLAIGNGMRPQVWKKFLARHGKHIKVLEFYAASESNCGFINMDGHIGSVGTLSPLRRAGHAIKLIKYDQENEEPVKDASGRFVDVPPGTPGLLIGKVTKISEFHGYRGNKALTEKKLFRNVIEEGDSYFNTGDLLKYDKDYHLYFVDRVGDTFRWKGENVSTTEVADAMSSAPSLKEVNVYGVEVDGFEGRVGMMVVILNDDEEFDCSGLYDYASELLPSYARPLFVRVKKEMELTGTYKHRKVQLVRDGFDPDNMGDDKVYFMSEKEKRYVLLTRKIVDGIRNKEIRI